MPTSMLFTMSVPPEEVPTLKRYPSAVALAFHCKSVVIETSIAPFDGVVKVVQLGTPAVVKDSSLQLVKSPFLL